MVASNEILAFLSGSYWSPAGQNARITYTIEGPAGVDDFGRPVNEPDPAFVESVEAALAAWSNVADVIFDFVPSSNVEIGNPFAQSPDDVDIVFEFGFGIDDFFQSETISATVTQGPGADQQTQLEQSRIVVDELFFQPDDLLPGANTSFTTLLSTVGVSLGLAWGRGIEDLAFLDELAQFEADLEFFNEVEQPIFELRQQQFDADFAQFLIDFQAFIAGGGVGLEPEAPEAPDAPVAPEPPTEPISDFPSFALDELTGDPITLTRSQATLDHTVVVQERIGGVAATLNGTEGGRPLGPQFFDIEAIQFLYGANVNFNREATIYDYSDGAQRAFTIWDGNGQDTLSAENFTGDASLDLRENEDIFSVIGASRIWIANGANIEDAQGGLGNDTITGNDLANRIFGNSGNDSIDTGRAADRVNGNQGNDTINGQDGDDFLRGGKDDDFLLGGTGRDVLLGDRQDDFITGDSGDDVLRGGKQNDTLSGGDGVDFIYGDRDDDNLTGGSGVDLFIFDEESGVDVINDFEGAGIVGGDVIQISSDVYNSLNEALSNFSNGVLDLGNGSSVTLIGVTNLIANDIQIIDI